MIIFLVGYMGSGKTTFGKHLARVLDWSFVDADKALEEIYGQNIMQMFESVGEEGFRQRESDWLDELELKNTIVALGGGTPCFNDNWRRINEKGVSIYLKLPVELLASRLYLAENVRPLIAGVKTDKPALARFIENQLSQRQPFYARANYTIHPEKVAPQDVINQLVEEGVLPMVE